jgi:hypothetical protein
MTATDRRHLNNLSLDQFHTVIFGEDTGLGHAVILLEGKEMSAKLYSHDRPHAR